MYFSVNRGVPAPINSAIPPHYSHPRQNGVAPEHAGALAGDRDRERSIGPVEGPAPVIADLASFSGIAALPT